MTMLGKSCVVVASIARMALVHLHAPHTNASSGGASMARRSWRRHHAPRKGSLRGSWHVRDNYVVAIGGSHV